MGGEYSIWVEGMDGVRWGIGLERGTRIGGCAAANWRLRRGEFRELVELCNP